MREKFAAVPNKDLPVPSFPDGKRASRQPPAGTMPVARKPPACCEPLLPAPRPPHPPMPPSPDVFLEEHRGVLVRALPVRDGHVLQIDWDMPPTDALYKQVGGGGWGCGRAWGRVAGLRCTSRWVDG